MNKKVIFANGCFDVLTVAHYKFLQFVQHIYEQIGYKIVISLDSDDKITKEKGQGRPIFTFKERSAAIQQLLPQKNLYIVQHNSNKELEEFIERATPFLVESARWRGQVVGQQHADGIIFFDEVYCPSTTDIIERVLKKNKSP